MTTGADERLRLVESELGGAAEILVGYGFNCFSWHPGGAAGTDDVLWAEAGFEKGDRRASGSGIPILFPFPGRIREGRFCYEGREFAMPTTPGHPHTLHGFVLDRPWRLIEQQPHAATGEFQASRDAPKVLEWWPADFRLRATYELQPGRLMSRFEVENPGSDPVPFGFGTHAYFRLPTEQTEIAAPVGRIWPMTDMILTGDSEAVAADHPLRTNRVLGGAEYDTVFTLAPESGVVETTLRFGAPARRVTQSFDADALRHLVVYTPPHREAICLEPYTCLPNPFELTDNGIDSGLRTLLPGERWSTSIVLAVD